MRTLLCLSIRQLASQVVATAILFLLLHCSDAYYYTNACNHCRFNTSDSIHSEHIYDTYFEAESACKEKCTEGCGSYKSDGYYACMEKWARKSCESRVGEVESNVNGMDVYCEFSDDAVDECVDQLIGNGFSCQVWCSASKNSESLYAYHSSWLAKPGMSSDVWGMCQKWECEHCEDNLEACIDTAWCIHPAWGGPIIGCDEYNPIIPVDEVTEGWYSSECWDESCLGILGEACFDEWSVCHQWCSLSQIPKCDEDRETCLNGCPFVMPVIFSEAFFLACPEACQAEFDACISSGDYDSACPVELIVESGGTEGTYDDSTRCAQIALYPSGEGDVIYEEICYHPDSRVPIRSNTFKFWLPEYFNCNLSKMHLLAVTNRGWFITGMSIRVGEQAEARSWNLTNPITQLTGVWLDGESYNSVVSGIPENKEWIFSLDEPALSFPRHRQFEVIFIADSTRRYGGSGMWPNLVLYPVDSRDTIHATFKLRSYGVYAGDIVSVQVGGTEDTMAAGSIEKFQLEATSTDGWFIERLYAKFGETFSEIDLFHEETGSRGIWLDGEPFDSFYAYGNTPTVQYYNVSDFYTFYE